MRKALRTQSRERFGDIFYQLVIREDIIKLKQKLLKKDPSITNKVVLQKNQEEVKKYLHFEEEFQRQKADITWFEKEDRNTRFFYSLVKDRRKRLQINRIKIGKKTGQKIRTRLQVLLSTFIKINLIKKKRGMILTS